MMNRVKNDLLELSGRMVEVFPTILIKNKKGDYMYCKEYLVEFDGEHPGLALFTAYDDELMKVLEKITKRTSIKTHFNLTSVRSKHGDTFNTRLKARKIQLL